MEKTMARAIYKAMELGKPYTTSDLFRLERGEISIEEAMRRYFEHRKTWIKAIND